MVYLFSNYSTYFSQLFSLVDCIKNDWKLWTSKDELEILDKHAKGGRRLTIIKMSKYFFNISFHYS